MTTLYEQRHPCGFVLSEGEGTMSRENLVVASGQQLAAGQVLGRRAVVSTAAATVAPAVGNAGDGAVTLDAVAPIRSDVETGVYTLDFLSGGATAEFNLISPSGRIVGSGAVGTPFLGPLKFAIADDAAKHYAAGDRITVTTTVGTFEHGAFDPAATDGLQNAVGLALYPANTVTAGYQAGVQGFIAGLMRLAEVNGAMLVWPSDIAPATQAAAIAQLGARSILVR